MYMRLFHGRDDPMAPMEEWGFDGPVFQIKGFLHSVYNHLLWVDHSGTENGDEMHYVDDCVYYDGKYYGEWSVFEAELPKMLQSALQPFDPTKALVLGMRLSNQTTAMTPIASKRPPMRLLGSESV